MATRKGSKAWFSERVEWVKEAELLELREFLQENGIISKVNLSRTRMLAQELLERLQAEATAKAKVASAKRRNGFTPSAVIDADAAATSEQQSGVEALRQEITELRGRLLAMAQVGIVEPPIEELVQPVEPATETADVTQVIEAEPAPVVSFPKEQWEEISGGLKRQEKAANERLDEALAQTDAQIAELKDQIAALQTQIGECVGKEGAAAIWLRLKNLEERKPDLTGYVTEPALAECLEKAKSDWWSAVESTFAKVSPKERKVLLNWWNQVRESLMSRPFEGHKEEVE